MIRAVELLIFLSLAAGVHLGLWATAPDRQGAAATGGGGEGAVTLAAATPQAAALARAWQTAPSVSETPVAAQPAPPALAPDVPAPIAPALTAPAAPRLTALLPERPPETPTAPAQRPTLPAPEAPQPPQANEAPQPTISATRPVARATPAPTAPRPAPRDPAPRADTSPPAPPQPPAAAAQAQRPSGSAAPRQPRAASGDDGADRTQSTRQASHNALQAQWGARIQRKVHRRMIYPRGASGTGTAKVALTISRSGQLTGLRLVRSSGTQAFDTAALSAVQRAGRFPAAPKALEDASYTFTLSLAFRP